MNSKIIVPLAAALTVLLPGLAASQSFDGGFKKRFYLGAGAGQSILNPDTSESDVFVVEENDTAAAVTLGFDLTRRLTAELQYADLGTVGLSGDDGITYAEASLSALYYIWNGFGAAAYLDQDGLDRRTGFSLYGRAGVGAMKNEEVRDVVFTRANDAQLLSGIGIEYAMDFGLGVRAEYIKYDSDAKFAGLSLLYRFGGGVGSMQMPGGLELPEALEEAPQELPELPVLPVLPAPEPIETLPPPPSIPTAAPVATDDADFDGVSDAFDECVDTQPGAPVGSNGCAMFNGTLEGVNFLSGSDTLTSTARIALDEVAVTLNAYPDIRISVEAHTDSEGPESLNLSLSRQRAIAVVRYLTAQGIALDRFEARAFGESQPIADNNTRAGRLLNRRVEFRTVQ